MVLVRGAGRPTMATDLDDMIGRVGREFRRMRLCSGRTAARVAADIGVPIVAVLAIEHGHPIPGFEAGDAARYYEAARSPPLSVLR